MTYKEYDQILRFLQSPDQEIVFLGYTYIVNDENYREAKMQLGDIVYDNSKCLTIGNTISELCKFVEHVVDDNTIMKGTWPVLRDSLYMPAGLCILDLLKNYLVED